VLSLFEKVWSAILDHEDQTAEQFSPALREGAERIMKDVESSYDGAASGRQEAQEAEPAPLRRGDL
jgi:hypothetical protein